MTFQRSGSRFPRASARRLTDWGFGPSSDSQVITGSGKTLWSVGTAPSQPLTLIRTRGLVTVYQTGATAIQDGFEGAHGIYMMTEDAFAVGVTAALDPFNDAGSDMWLWHSFFDVRAITATIADGVNANALHSRIEIDSKAMRKGFDAERVMVGVTGSSIGGTASMELHANTRQLFKT